MSAILQPFRFTCACCGKTVTDLPDIAFTTPDYHNQIPEAERVQRARLGTDFCVLDAEDYFIRVVCPIPILGTDQSFMWGVWTTLSEANFHRYIESFDDPGQSKLGGMFGWLSNRIPHYPDTLNLQTTVWPQDNDQRPHLWINSTHADHPLYREQHEGMSPERLGEIYAQQVCDAGGR